MFLFAFSFTDTILPEPIFLYRIRNSDKPLEAPTRHAVRVQTPWMSQEFVGGLLGGSPPQTLYHSQRVQFVTQEDDKITVQHSGKDWWGVKQLRTAISDVTIKKCIINRKILCATSFSTKLPQLKVNMIYFIEHLSLLGTEWYPENLLNSNVKVYQLWSIMRDIDDVSFFQRFFTPPSPLLAYYSQLPFASPPTPTSWLSSALKINFNALHI